MRPGLTLMEVLAVTVLLTLLAGLGMPALIRRVSGDPLADAVERCVTETTAIRAQALPHGITMEMTADGLRSQGTHPIHVRFDDNIVLQWTAPDGSPISSLVVDRSGRSADVLLDITGHGRSQRLVWDGLSGEWRRLP